MAEYIDREKLKERLQEFSNWCRDGRKQGVDFVLDCPLPDMPTEDVVPRKEVNDLEYKLIGVMHSVDKWLECDELNQDEVNRAITMREKTLNIVEELQKKLNDYERVVGKLSFTVDGVATLLIGENVEYIDKRVADGFKNLAVKQAKQEVAREIFEEIEKLTEMYSVPKEYRNLDFVVNSCENSLKNSYAELKKKYIGE